MKFKIYTILSCCLFLTITSAQTIWEVHSEAGPYVRDGNIHGQYQTHSQRYSSNSVSSGSPINRNGYGLNMGLENDYPQNFGINYVGPSRTSFAGPSNQNDNFKNYVANMEHHARMRMQQQAHQDIMNQIENNNNYGVSTNHNQNFRISITDPFSNDPFFNPTTEGNNNDDQSYQHIPQYGQHIRPVFNENHKTPLAPIWIPDGQSPYAGNIGKSEFVQKTDAPEVSNANIRTTPDRNNI